MATIELHEITKHYRDGFEAVKDMSLQVADGEFMILVGPSGCGKSTALRMIAGLEDITRGELRIGGALVNDVAPKDRDIAMVFQNYALYPHMTVRDNMGFALKLRGAKRDEIRRRVAEAAGVLDLEQHLDRKPAQLSGGQRQRVAMGRAIVREPKAFLMDEPLSNLDAKLRVEMRTAISKLQKRLGTTTVYVTHDQTEAMTLGDRVAVMRGGVLQQVDAPKLLYERPRNLFVAGFIGSPAMNFLAGEVDGDVVRTPIGAVPLHAEVRQRLDPRAAGAREVVVGIRPEHFEDAALAGGRDGWTFEVPVELTESMGSEIYVHFDFDRGGALGGEAASELRELRTAAGGEAPQSGFAGYAVARVSASSSIEAGERAALWLDARKLLLFDARDGSALSSPRDLAAVA